MFAFLDVPVAGAYHLVSTLAELSAPVLGELATALAIVVFTAGVRLLLHPLARAAMRGERVRAELAPKFQELSRRHRDDPERLRREMARLQVESGGSLFAGCLPMLLQLPFFMVMYRLFASTEIGGRANELLGHTLFGAPLGGHFLTAGMPHALVYLGLLATLACVATCTVRWQARMLADAAGPQPPGMALLRWLPYGTVLVAAVVPLAAGVYLLTTTTWTVVERAALKRATLGRTTPGKPGSPPGLGRGKLDSRTSKRRAT
jgi:YidC/Oxa1 family membrane protein insertase